MASSDHTSKYDKFEQRIRGHEATSDTTVSMYRMWAMRFESWRPRDEPTEALLRDFDSLLQDPARTDYPWENHRGRPAPDEYAFRSRTQAISALKLWAKIQYGNDIRTNPKNICYGEPEPFDPTYLPPDQCEDIIASASQCSNAGCEAAVAVGYDAILRGAELANLKVSNADVNNGTLYVNAVKGSNNATLKLGETAREKLRHHVDRIGGGERLFTNAYGNRWTPNAWNRHFRMAHHGVGFHAFARHSAIVNRLNAGEGFGDVYRRARHSNAEMTTKYARLVGVEPPEWVDG